MQRSRPAKQPGGVKDFPSWFYFFNQLINKCFQMLSRLHQSQVDEPVQLFPMLWRFFPTLDPQVSMSHIFLIIAIKLRHFHFPGGPFRQQVNPKINQWKGKCNTSKVPNFGLNISRVSREKNCFVFRKFDSRDLDSLPTKREAAAVEEWLQSGKRLHAMRDNPYHW